MNLQSRVSLFENQVDMTRNLLAQCRGMRRHLTLHVLPNLSDLISSSSSVSWTTSSMRSRHIPI